MSEDAKWPRASGWLESVPPSQTAQLGADIALFGVPAHLTSISRTNAHLTPAAIRSALQRYSLWSWTHRTDLSSLKAIDFGDIENPDSAAGEARTSELAQRATKAAGLTIALGGDNSISYATVQGVFAGSLQDAGLITLDAHHDLRDGVSNGSPVRRLIDAGLDPKRIVQIGIADFSNSPEYAALADSLGITVIARSELRQRAPADVWAQALSVAAPNRRPGSVFVDFDMDVCDRSVVPGCPAAAPGGIGADELRQFGYLAGNSAEVAALDITEIDASADSADQRTVRLAALLILEAAAGVAVRKLRQ